MWHLPAHHPVASSLLASLRQTVNQDIKDGKCSPLNAYAMQELARLSPFGIFTPPSTSLSTGNIAAGSAPAIGAFLPQAESSLFNLFGRNAFGTGALKEAPTPGAKYGTPGYSGEVNPLSGPSVAATAENLLESFLPLARYARIAEQGGKPSYGTGTILSPQVKPGGGSPSVGTTLGRILNPLYSIQNAQATPNAPAYGPSVPKASKGTGGYVLGAGAGNASGGYVLGAGGAKSTGGYVLGSGG